MWSACSKIITTLTKWYMFVIFKDCLLHHDSVLYIWLDKNMRQPVAKTIKLTNKAMNIITEYGYWNDTANKFNYSEVIILFCMCVWCNCGLNLNHLGKTWVYVFSPIYGLNNSVKWALDSWVVDSQREKQLLLQNCVESKKKAYQCYGNS